MSSIRYFSEGIDFSVPQPRKVVAWIKTVLAKERRKSGDINYIFCSDEYLLGLNQQYLKHNTYTDIITFDYSPGRTIQGEVYISVERVRENANKLGVLFEDELRRVMIHGVLHLCGYKDKEQAQKAQMRKKEEAYLSLWHISK
jgi:probable rRNA maturation factor